MVLFDGGGVKEFVLWKGLECYCYLMIMWVICKGCNSEGRNLFCEKGEGKS